MFLLENAESTRITDSLDRYSTQLGKSVLKLLPLPLRLPRGSSLLQVFCDMETSGGGWTIIQRRKSGLVSFYQDWRQYKQGFGSIRGDFWLGNEHIHRLTRQPSRLRVELEVSSSCKAPSGPGPLHTWFIGITTVYSL